MWNLIQIFSSAVWKSQYLRYSLYSPVFEPKKYALEIIYAFVKGAFDALAICTSF